MQRIENYGSFLQAYGLKKTIEKMGHEVQFVDYKIEPSLIAKTDGNNDKVFISKVKKGFLMFSPTYRNWRKRQIMMNKTFDEFLKVFHEKYFPELGICDKKNLVPQLDVLVIGSDEVFNCTQKNEKVGYSKQLFGVENRAERLISYAASFGSTMIEKLEKYGIEDEIGNYLSDFDAISVRDNNSYNIVKTLVGVSAYKNIDPVLLYAFEEIDGIEAPMKDYIIVYAYADRIKGEEVEEIRKFARQRKKKIISLGFYQPFCDEWILATPLEVLVYIKYADYVITDTFHGTVFSIKYQKRFGTIVRESNVEKLGDLLRTFNLEKRQITNLQEIPEIVESPMDENSLKILLDKKREEAFEYLLEKL